MNWSPFMLVCRIPAETEPPPFGDTGSAVQNPGFTRWCSSSQLSMELQIAAPLTSDWELCRYWMR